MSLVSKTSTGISSTLNHDKISEKAVVRATVHFTRLILKILFSIDTKV